MCCFSWRSDFRIKKKADVDSMFEGTAVSGEFYFCDNEKDYRFEKPHDSDGMLSWRFKCERGDIFSPYLCVSKDEAKEIVWKNRKAINSYLGR